MNGIMIQFETDFSNRNTKKIRSNIVIDDTVKANNQKARILNPLKKTTTAKID